MNKWGRSILCTSLLIIIFNVLPKGAHAQIDPGEDPDAPVDGGIGLLVIAGVAYGVKKVRDSKKMHRSGEK